MTKNTSQKIVFLKKIAVIPILAGLIYYFCIEIVAKEKTIKNKEYKSNAVAYATSETDQEISKNYHTDEYFKGVRIKYYDKLVLVDDNDKNPNTIGAKYPKLIFNKKYEELTKEEKEEIEISLILSMQKPLEKKSPSEQELKEFQNSKKFAIWIDGKNVANSELNKYNVKDFTYYSGSVILKNARTKKHPQPFQYWFYTLPYFEKQNIGKKRDKYPGDEIVIFKDGKNFMITPTEKSAFKAEAIENKKIIVIDAGHGGHDTGSKIDDDLESKIVESIAKKISLLNQENDIEIILLREHDSFIDLNERVNRINKINPDLVLSLHLNSSKNKNGNGINAYVSPLNNFYRKALEKAEGLIDKISNDNLKKGAVKDANLFVIKNSKCPAILLEIGYLSNENDRKYLTSESGKNEIANRIFNFLKL